MTIAKNYGLGRAGGCVVKEPAPYPVPRCSSEGCRFPGQYGTRTADRKEIQFWCYGCFNAAFPREERDATDGVPRAGDHANAPALR